jgi:hypothetical protein
MLTLIDTVLEFYIYFLTGKKFREEVYHVISEIIQYTPLRNYFKFTRSNIRTTNLTSSRQRNYVNKHNYLSSSSKQSTKTADSCIDSSPKRITIQLNDMEETLDRIESTV